MNILITLAVILGVLAGSVSPAKIDDPMPLVDLGFDTRYVPLPDINSTQITETTLSENQTLLDGIIFDKTIGYDAVAAMNDTALLPDGNGGYFTVKQVEEGNGYADICIARYDSGGGEIKRQAYGGSDFDIVCAAKYNPKMGIVLSGISQITDGDFAHSPFAACVDAETLALKWVYPVQNADSVYCVTDGAVFVVHNEGAPYNGSGDLKLSVVKLDGNGKKIWQTEPLSQQIRCIAELTDGRILVVQAFAESGAVLFFSKDGTKLAEMEADCYGDVTPTDDGGFIMVSVRNIKTVPQPAYVSATWYDTETVVAKYDRDGAVEWRKTYDRVKDAVGTDSILPQRDGNVLVG